MGKNISEPNLLEFLIVILKVQGSITLQDFIRRVPNAFDLTEADLEQSLTRPNEKIYEQRCRNLNSHKSFPVNLIQYKNQVFTWIGK